MARIETVRVDSLKVGNEFELIDPILGLEPDRYIFIGDKAGAKWILAGSVKIESRHGDEFVIPENTQVIPL